MGYSKPIAQDCWEGLNEMLPVKGQAHIYRLVLGVPQVTYVRVPDVWYVKPSNVRCLKLGSKKAYGK